MKNAGFSVEATEGKKGWKTVKFSYKFLSNDLGDLSLNFEFDFNYAKVVEAITKLKTYISKKLSTIKAKIGRAIKKFFSKKNKVADISAFQVDMTAENKALDDENKSLYVDATNAAKFDNKAKATKPEDEKLDSLLFYIPEEPITADSDDKTNLNTDLDES